MWQNILLIFNLFILEALLSVDNAAVLAVLVKGLPPGDSKKALRYGIWGAYALRGGCLFIATLLTSLWYLKVIGGIYLLYLTYGHFSKKADTLDEDVAKGRNESRVYRFLRKNLGLSELWLTIILVEIMDLTFSIDNILASVALSSNMWVICLGVFMGIAAMRFVAMRFVGLMRIYPSLERSAFIVIGLLGLKLIVSVIASKGPLHTFMASHWFDLWFSIVMMAIFFFPLLGKRQKPGPILNLANSVEDNLRNGPL